MTKKTILITGITGFIGKRVAEALASDYDLTAIVRPGTDETRLSPALQEANIIYIDLASTSELEAFLKWHSFDFIVHIGALRGGRRCNKQTFINTNLKATEALVANAIANQSKLIFCSSVGVYGAIPSELPAGLATAYKADNLYHNTKIKCEQLILKEVGERGLDACIVRPAITYGKGDFGFPHTLVKLVSKGLLLLPRQPVYIHMANVEVLVEAFCEVTRHGFTSGSIYNVADEHSVGLLDLVDFIYNSLTKKGKYPRWHLWPRWLFSAGAGVAKLFRNELWVSRFELLAHDWYFDVQPVYTTYQLANYNTIPDFQVVIDWFNAGDGT